MKPKCKVILLENGTTMIMMLTTVIFEFVFTFLQSNGLLFSIKHTPFACHQKMQLAYRLHSYREVVIGTQRRHTHSLINNLFYITSEHESRSQCNGWNAFICVNINYKVFLQYFLHLKIVFCISSTINYTWRQLTSNFIRNMKVSYVFNSYPFSDAASTIIWSQERCMCLLLENIVQ